MYKSSHFKAFVKKVNCHWAPARWIRTFGGLTVWWPLSSGRRIDELPEPAFEEKQDPEAHPVVEPPGGVLGEEPLQRVPPEVPALHGALGEQQVPRHLAELATEPLGHRHPESHLAPSQHR